MRIGAIVLIAATCVTGGRSSAAGKVSPEALIDLARTKGSSSQFREAVKASLPDADLKKGTAFVGVGPDFLCVLEADTEPKLYVDDRAVAPMKSIPGTNLWYSLSQLATGTSHEYHYLVNGARVGGRSDVPAYLPESYEQPGVPEGKLSEKLIHTSKIYDGMVSDYWIYVPAQYDPKTPAALMVWQDGQGHVQRDGGARTLNVIDNLIHQKRIPVMIQVFISPGKVGERLSAVRSLYLSAAYGKAFLELKLLVLAQAAEAYHRRSYEGQDCYMDAAAYADTVAAPLKAAIPTGINSSLRQPLKSRLAYGNEYSFRRRLTVLFKEHGCAALSSHASLHKRIPNRQAILNHLTILEVL